MAPDLRTQSTRRPMGTQVREGTGEGGLHQRGIRKHAKFVSGLLALANPLKFGDKMLKHGASEVFRKNYKRWEMSSRRQEMFENKRR